MLFSAASELLASLHLLLPMLCYFLVRCLKSFEIEEKKVYIVVAANLLEKPMPPGMVKLNGSLF